MAYGRVGSISVQLPSVPHPATPTNSNRPNTIHKNLPHANHTNPKQNHPPPPTTPQPPSHNSRKGALRRQLIARGGKLGSFGKMGTSPIPKRASTRPSLLSL